MFLADEGKQKRISTTYHEPHDWSPSLKAMPTKKVNQNIRSKTPTVPNMKRKSSLPEGVCLTSRKSSPTSRRSDVLNTESFLCRSPMKRQYSGGSTGIYYEVKAEKILQSAMNTSSSAIYKRVNLSSSTSPSPRKTLSSKYVDSPLKTLHTARN